MENNLKVFTAFSGYDSQCLALDRLGIDYELVGWSEIDKYAIQAHNALYPQWSDRNFGDISKIDWDLVPDFDLFTYSFPCTDISTAKKDKKGCDEGSGTQSALLWECRKAIRIKKPQILLMENVKALKNLKNMPNFQKWLQILNDYGYKNFYTILNAKDFGLPQDRARLFTVSILNGGAYDFIFPNETIIKKPLIEMINRDVKPKYFLKNYKKGDVDINTCPIKPINTTKDGLSRTIKAQYYKNGVRNLTRESGFGATGVLYSDGENFLIRKFTPTECFRLMGVSEADIEKLNNTGICDTWLYKLAGNSIPVDVLCYIFKNLLCTNLDHTNQTL